MRCKIFTGIPSHVERLVNDWCEKEDMKSIYISSVTQSYEEVHGNLILTIIYVKKEG